MRGRVGLHFQPAFIERIKGVYLYDYTGQPFTSFEIAEVVEEKTVGSIEQNKNNSFTIYDKNNNRMQTVCSPLYRVDYELIDNKISMNGDGKH